LHGPAHLNAVAVINGFLPRSLESGFTWADFSCGNGFDAAIHAAANPQGRFYAVGAAARARALLAEAPLENLSLVADSLAELPDDALPPLDFAIFDGGFMTLAEDARTAALKRIADMLKPGGMLLLGYHALPGFAAMMPMRDVLHSLTADHERTPEVRVRAALDWLADADAAGTGFLGDHAGVRRRVAAYADCDPEVVAAELFGPMLKPFHFAQVEGTAKGARLAFGGNAEIFLNLIDLALPAATRRLAQRAKSRTALETLRDALRNPFYRRDLYVKGAAIASEATFWKAHDELIVDLAPGAPEAVDFGGHLVQFTGFPFDSLKTGLADGPRPVAGIPGLIPELARDAVRAGLAAGIVRIRPHLAATPQRPHGEVLSVPLAVNRAILKSAIHLATPVPLASPLTGGFLVLSRAEAVALDAIATSGCRFAEAETAIVAHLKASAGDHAADPGADATFHAVAREGLAALTPERLATLARDGVIAG
jgi:SAM-dependent methyltransferase